MANPFANMAPTLLCALGEKNVVTVRRYPVGTYANGIWQRGANTDFLLDAVVQPVGPREVMQLPELERTKEAIAIYSTQALETGDVETQDDGDFVLFDGKTYRVLVVEDWTSQAGYAKALATRVKD